MLASLPPTFHLKADRDQLAQGIFSVCEIPPTDFSNCDLFIVLSLHLSYRQHLILHSLHY